MAFQDSFDIAGGNAGFGNADLVAVDTADGYAADAADAVDAADAAGSVDNGGYFGGLGGLGGVHAAV